MKRRSESFFGMHFDFHAKKDQENIGEFCDYDTIDQLLTEVKPDYIQCDTKGHPGISSYPTKVGTPAPNMKGDILKMWREETEKHDVALFSHYSGVWDSESIVKNPTWAAIDADGMQDELANSVFGPYVDKLLIPQIIELSQKYGVNGAWIDGDCWGAIEDYSPWAREVYKKETGLEVPDKDDFEGREKYRDFCRKGFLKYVEHYCNEIHKLSPEFQIASNWLYTSYAPEPENIDVDFISGDYSPSNSVNSAIFEGRALQNANKPWDLMAWGFTREPRASKELVQLCLEAATVIALGGGFQIYNVQHVGTIEKQYIDKWKKLAEFCREREKVCHKAKPVHEGAVLYSRKALFHHKDTIYRRWDTKTNQYYDDTRGLLSVILDAGYSTELLLSHQFMKMTDNELLQYGFIAISDLMVIEDEIKERLINYVKNGGEVLICGANSSKLFEKELGIKIDIDGESKSNCIVSNNKYGTLSSVTTKVVLKDADVLDYYYTNSFCKEENKRVFSTIKKDEKGKWIGIYLNIGEYLYAKNVAIRDIIDEKIKLNNYRKIVEIENTHIPQIVVTKKDGKIVVNMLNVNSPHSNSSCLNYDEIVPLYNLNVSVMYSHKPKSVFDEISKTPINFEYFDGRVVFTIGKLDIHSVITIK